MLLSASLRQASAALTSNPKRSLLTMFGICWGIASFILAMSLGDGFEQAQYSSLAAMGRDLIVISGGQTSQQAGGRTAGRVISLTYDDVVAIRAQCPSISEVSPERIYDGLSVASVHKASSFSVHGVEEQYQSMRLVQVSEGRLLNQADVEFSRRVCLIGPDVQDRLYAAREPLGDSLRIAGIPFTIIGILKHKDDGASYFGSDNSKILVPFSSAEAFLPAEVSIKHFTNAVVVRPRQAAEHLTALKEVRQLLALEHRFNRDDEDALDIDDTIKSAQTIQGIGKGFRYFFLSVSAITILIGGIGVLNIMLVSVAERTWEIGLRKAIGAKKVDILLQFLVECFTLTGLAGAAGISIGCAVALGLGALVKALPPPLLSLGLAEEAFFSIAIIGLASGLYPALRAARMTPIEALRAQ